MPTVTELLANPEAVGVWTVDPARSAITFKTKSLWGLVPVKGRFSTVGGDGQITDAGTAFGRLDIDAASLDTKLKKRDKDLRKPEFFDVEKYPNISVVVTGVDLAKGDTVDVRADLTVKGTTRPLPLRATVTVLDDGAVRVSGQTTIDRTDFGVTGNLMGMVGSATVAGADLVFRRAS